MKSFKQLIVGICLVFAACFFPLKSAAQDYSKLFRDFRLQDLNFDERRYLQTALAFQGHYFGLLDGDCGRLSREAMSRYSWKEYGTKTSSG